MAKGKDKDLVGKGNRPILPKKQDPKPCRHSWQNTSPHTQRCVHCGTSRTT